MPSVSAPIIAAGIGAAGSIGGALLGGSSAQSAANAQEQAAQLSVAEQQREYDQTRSDHMPWLTTGGSALDQLAKIYGLDTSQNGQTVKGSGTTDYSSFYKSPDYAFAQQQGLAGVDAGAAAGGSLDSGATRKAEINFSSGLASQNFNNYANRLAGIAGVGQTAANSLGTLGANTANQISNAYTQSGDAQASSYLAQGNSYAQGLAGLGGYANSALNSYMQSSAPSGGYGTYGSSPNGLNWGY